MCVIFIQFHANEIMNEMQPQFKRKEETGADEKWGCSLPGRFLPSPHGEFGKRNRLCLHYLSAVFF